MYQKSHPRSLKWHRNHLPPRTLSIFILFGADAMRSLSDEVVHVLLEMDAYGFLS